MSSAVTSVQFYINFSVSVAVRFVLGSCRTSLCKQRRMMAFGRKPKWFQIIKVAQPRRMSVACTRRAMRTHTEAGSAQFSVSAATFFWRLGRRVDTCVLTSWCSVPWAFRAQCSVCLCHRTRCVPGRHCNIQRSTHPQEEGGKSPYPGAQTPFEPQQVFVTVGEHSANGAFLLPSIFHMSSLQIQRMLWMPSRLCPVAR